MKTIMTVAAFVAFLATRGFSQDDSTRYINGLPVSEDDTAQVSNRDLGPRNKMTAVTPDELPRKLRKALEEGDQFDGWQDTTIYLERNTGLYLVPLRYDEGVKIFGLNRNGKPVTYDEVSQPDSQ